MSRSMVWLAATSLLLGAVSLSALAQPREREHERDHDRGRGRGWGGDIRHFESHDAVRWRQGYWHHGHHEGRLGWWWVIGGLWYFYPQPVYPYPDPYQPPVVVIQQSAPVAPAPAPAPAPSVAAPQVWYYCEASSSYYPYVPTCPGGWKVVPATPPTPPQ